MTPGRCSCNIWLVIFKLISRIAILSTVEVLIFDIFFQRLQLCKWILISYIIVKCNWLDSGQSPLIRVFDVEHYSCWTNTGRVRSSVRSQFDYLSQLHWIADIYPSGVTFLQCGPAVAVMFSSCCASGGWWWWGWWGCVGVGVGVIVIIIAMNYSEIIRLCTIKRMFATIENCLIQNHMCSWNILSLG